MARPSLNAPLPPATDPRKYKQKALMLLKAQIDDAANYRLRNQENQDADERKRLDSLAQTAAIKMLDIIKSGALNDTRFDQKSERHHAFIMKMLDMDEQEFEREIQREEIIGTFTPGVARLVRKRYREAMNAIQDTGRHQESTAGTGGVGEGTTTGDNADDFDFVSDGPEA